MARPQRQKAVQPQQPSRPMAGPELQRMRSDLGLTQPGVAALIHLLGGTAPARSTISRIERKEDAPAEWAVIFMLLSRFQQPKKSWKPVHVETLAEHRVRKTADPNLAGRETAEAGNQLDEEWKANLLSLVKSGRRLSPAALEGVEDRTFLLELAMYDAALVSEHALAMGYGPIEARRAEDGPDTTRE